MRSTRSEGVKDRGGSVSATPEYLSKRVGVAPKELNLRANALSKNSSEFNWLSRSKSIGGSVSSNSENLEW